MANVKKALYNVAVFLVSLFITGSINVSNIKNTQDTSRVTLTVNETETLQEMNGWGSAAAWWAQVAGGSKNADDIAKLLYSKEGLGLNIYIQIQRRLGRKAEPQLPSRSRFVEEHGELPCI